MTQLVYDGTFGGLLTAIFEVYEYKFSGVEIIKEDLFQPDAFSIKHRCATDSKKVIRVWRGLANKISAGALSQFHKAYLSEIVGIEKVLLDYFQYAFGKKQNIEGDYSHPSVLTVAQTAKKVDREKHRMEAFVRFQLTKDNLFYALCQPDFNVLPLIKTHFQKRYADQRWLIYDSRRKYGIYYDLSVVETVELTFAERLDDTKKVICEEDELYQQLWQQYFSSVNIKARNNLKLHIQHMPKRYWRFLPEKQPLHQRL